MIKPRRLPRPLLTIEEFLRTFDASQPEAAKKRDERQKLLKNFQETFPKDSLATLSPKRYVIGTGTKDTFCYWMERTLAPVGKYAPHNAEDYLLYLKMKDRTTFVFRRNPLKSADDANAPMQEIATLLSKLVTQRDTAEALKHLGSRFVLKVLHSYYPREYMPINVETELDNALNLLGEDAAGMNAVEKNRRVQTIFEEKNQKSGGKVTNDEFKDFLEEKFGLEEKAVIEMDELVAQGASTLVQFHPAYSYEDFVRGITAKVNEAGQVSYETEDKTLAQLARQALDRPTANFVLIIDEINRANLPAVLGELIYALEYRHDPGKASEAPVQGMYTVKAGSSGEGGTREIRLPKNLYIIGTMNSADRSIGHLDYAIRRHFAFADVLPQVEVLHEIISDEVLRVKAVALFERVATLFTADYLAADYTDAQVQPGHSYFLADTEGELGLRLRYEIQPLLREYVRDGVLRPTASEEIDKLNV